MTRFPLGSEMKKLFLERSIKDDEQAEEWN